MSRRTSILKALVEKFKLIDGNDPYNINIFNNPIKYTAVNFMNQAISKYYSVEYYLDNVFNKAPILSKKTLAIFDKSERKLARKEELVEEEEEKGLPKVDKNKCLKPKHKKDCRRCEKCLKP